MQLRLVHGREVHTIELGVDGSTTLEGLGPHVEAATGVPASTQRLIVKGRTLVDSKPLVEQGITSNTKIMVMTCGPGAHAKAAATPGELKQRAAAAREKAQKRLAAMTPAAPEDPKVTRQRRLAGWKRAGVAGMPGCELRELPEELLDAELMGQLRVLDLSNNQLTDLPEKARGWAALQQLKLHGNRLSQVPAAVWQLSSCLHTLTLHNNQLHSLPEGLLGGLKGMRRLSLAGNRLAQLPDSVGELQLLEVLDVSANRLQTLSASLGRCSRLEMLAADNNRIQALPPQLGTLPLLTVLSLNSNRIADVPSEIFLGCTSLRMLALHDNPCSMQQLQAKPGFAAYEARKGAKYTKQIEMAVFFEGFDEGADFDKTEPTERL